MHLLWLLVLTLLPQQVVSHAYVYWPTSREAKMWNSAGCCNVGSPYSYADKKVAGYLGDRYSPKLASKHGAGQGGAPQNRKKLDTDWSKSADGCNGMPSMSPADMVTYQQGQEIEVVLPVHAEHGGEYEFRLCDKKWDSMSTDMEKLECLDERLVYRGCVQGETSWGGQCSCTKDHCKRWAHIKADDPLYTKYPGIGLYNGDTACAEGGQSVKFTLPEDVNCEQCTLQWYWYTFHNEEFWGCSDIKITAKEEPDRRRRDGSGKKGRRRRRRKSRRRSKKSRRRRSRRSRRRKGSLVAAASNEDASRRGLLEDVVYRRLGCVSDAGHGARASSAEEYNDKACLKTEGHSEKDPCRGGLPFFSTPVDPASSLGACFRFCTSMGLDLFGVANSQTECRCGASAENDAVWGEFAAAARKRGLQLNYAQLEKEGDSCDRGIMVYQYSAWLETNALGTVDLLKSVDPKDKEYIDSIIRGAA
jgi:hypothetical protein